ncbi:hypothetical protein H0H81_007519 [Sphagnurus paluster]|uniref:Uncharacterized protein n=1 Tax=Sphagnurus paluster TaxID=117069 RepID=A0A9P7KMS8_9AGAR|nr:hypothetical protein H0H81_007519 [Sphagnurus paluster]
MADRTLRYNIRWIESTFSSRTATEALLGPERESGNVTSHDYDAATEFFPGFHRHYRVRIIIIVLIRPLSVLCHAVLRSDVIYTPSLCRPGFLIGHVMSISAHYNFVRSIENPEGFSQALDNIQKNTGSFPPNGPIIVRQGGKWAVDHDAEVPVLENGSHGESSPVPSTQTPTKDPVPSIKPMSKWDQIRAANSRTTPHSSWDALRQNHERARVSPEGASSATPEFERTRGDDRALEQAKFDELLEKERNMK